MVERLIEHLVENYFDVELDARLSKTFRCWFQQQTYLL